MTNIITVDNNVKYGNLLVGDIIKEKEWNLQNKEYIVTKIEESKSKKSVIVMVKTKGHSKSFYRSNGAVRKTTMVIDDWQINNK